MEHWNFEKRVSWLPISFFLFWKIYLCKRYARHRWMWRLWGSILLSKWRYRFNLASTDRIVFSDSIASSGNIASSDRISYFHTTFNRIIIDDAAEKYWPIKEIEQLIKKKFFFTFNAFSVYSFKSLKISIPSDIGLECDSGDVDDCNLSLTLEVLPSSCKGIFANKIIKVWSIYYLPGISIGSLVGFLRKLKTKIDQF